MRILTHFLTAALLCTATAAQAQLSNYGLLAYYPFSGNTLDASGNGNHIINSGAVLTTSQTGHPDAAYAFDGRGAYMMIPARPALHFNGDYSICMKVKPTGFYTGNCHANNLFSNGNDDIYGSVNIRFDDRLYTSNRHCSTPTVDTVHQNFYGFQVYGNAVPDINYPLYASHNTWRSIIFSQVGDSLMMYVDAVKIHTVHNPRYGSFPATDILLGKLNSINYPYYFNGVMDELRIYNRGLGAEEIINYHNYDPAATPASVELTSLISGIYIFPNPATKQITVDNLLEQPAAYQINALNGSLLTTGTLQVGSTIIPTENLAAGLYLLHVQNETHKQTLRFVKQ